MIRALLLCFRIFSFITASDSSELSFYSQQGEDAIAVAELFTAQNGQVLNGGVYLEVGGLDGILNSNTLALDRHLNWRGVLIEGCPENAEKMAFNRPSTSTIKVKQAICDEGQHTVQFAGECGEHSRVAASLPWGNQAKNREVPCSPMKKILADEGFDCIDFMSIDVEGFEVNLLKTIDFSRVRIRSILIEVEHNVKRETIRNILMEAGFKSRGMLGPFLGNELWTAPGEFKNKSSIVDACEWGRGATLQSVIWPSDWPAASEISSASGKICAPVQGGATFRFKDGKLHPEVEHAIRTRDASGVTHGALEYYTSATPFFSRRRPHARRIFHNSTGCAQPTPILKTMSPETAHALVDVVRLVEPIPFSYPTSRFNRYSHMRVMKKTKSFSTVLPSHEYTFASESSYIEGYAHSYFAVTTRKYGWDCLRHYEILAAGTVPYFFDIERLPEATMVTFPRHLVMKAMSLPGVPSQAKARKFMNNNLKIKLGKEFWGKKTQAKYFEIRQQLIKHMAAKMLTKHTPLRLPLPRSLNQEAPLAKVWFRITTQRRNGNEVDYLHSTLLIGLLEQGYEVYSNANAEHLFEDTKVKTSGQYGNGFTITRTLDANMRSRLHPIMEPFDNSQIAPNDGYIISTFAGFGLMEGSLEDLHGKPFARPTPGNIISIDGYDEGFRPFRVFPGVTNVFRRELKHFNSTVHLQVRPGLFARS